MKFSKDKILLYTTTVKFSSELVRINSRFTIQSYLVTKATIWWSDKNRSTVKEQRGGHSHVPRQHSGCRKSC